MTEPTLNLLLVEDDDVSAEAVTRSIHRWRPDVPLVHAADGLEALFILRGAHVSKRIDLPRIVLLDLNMPRMNGFEFLEAIRSDASLRETIIFVLTSSDDDIDISRSYHENIAGYMVKTAVGPQCSKLVQLLASFLGVVRMPKNAAHRMAS